MHTALSILVAIACVGVVQPSHGGEPSESVSICIGESGVCMYGHWLSGEVRVRRDSCEVRIEEFLVHPTVSGVEIYSRVGPCSAIEISKAASVFERVSSVLGKGGMVITAPFYRSFVSSKTRREPGFQKAIQDAKSSSVPIDAANWEPSYLMPFVAEQIRCPMSVKFCTSFE